MSCPFIHLAEHNTHTNGNGMKGAHQHHDHDQNIDFSKLLITLHSSPDAAFLLSREGKIIYSNPASKILFLSNVDGTSFTSLFTFTSSSSDDNGRGPKKELQWDELAEKLSTSGEPDRHDVTVQETDGTVLGFRVNLAKLSTETAQEGMDVFACAYVIPLHDLSDDDKEEVRASSSSAVRGGTACGTIAEEGGGYYATDHQRDILNGKHPHLDNHMRDVVQASLDPMFSLFENGTIWMANDRTVEIFGYPHSELIGNNIVNICPGAVATHADTGQKKVIHHADSGGIHEKNQKQTTVTHKSGKQIPVELGTSRLSTAVEGLQEPIYFAHIKDLSAFEEQKAQIEHKDVLCQAMINASFDPMFGIDQRGKIMVCNKAACSMFGYTKEEFLNSNISIICNARDAIDHDKHLARYVRTGEKRIIGKKRPLEARRKDGSNFHIELGVSEVNLSNGEKMFCGYVRDVTQARMDKMNLRRKDALIQDKFFKGMEVEGKRAGAKRDMLRDQSMPERKMGEMGVGGEVGRHRSTMQ